MIPIIEKRKIQKVGTSTDSKFLELLDISAEKDDRKCDSNDFKKSMAEVTTELIDESEQERSQRNIAAYVEEEEATL